MLKEKVKAYIEKIRAIDGVRGCALVSRDGIMLGQSMEKNFNEPWLAAMCATLFASAESASSILGMAPPEDVCVHGGATSIMILGAGEKLLVVVVGDRGFEHTAGARSVEVLAGEIGGSF
ncbi:MAG: roadblock/LC7 domain-containing protein [Methanolinea sp.]|nr:roadblock/LC7 domain-containing protein [Methanolinea sp.]